MTTILDHIVVKKGSTKEEVHLDVHLKFGDPYGVVFHRENSSFLLQPSKKYYTQTGEPGRPDFHRHHRTDQGDQHLQAG